MLKKIDYSVKEKIVQLAGSCFWFWSDFYSFLDSCGVDKNIYRLYPKDAYNKYNIMRNILSYLEDGDNIEIINNIISNFFKLNSPINPEKLDVKKAEKQLREFKEIVKNDPIEKEIENRNFRENSKKSLEDSRRMINKNSLRDDLKNKFTKLNSNVEISPQQRGFELEDIFYQLLELEEFEYHKSFRNDSEQIDGSFKYDKFDYLIEIKWTKEETKQEDLSIFDGKIRGKAQSTRGLFISINNFDISAINKFSGDSPRIILMDGQDLFQILDGYTTLYDYMKERTDLLVRSGKIYNK